MSTSEKPLPHSRGSGGNCLKAASGGWKAEGRYVRLSSLTRAPRGLSYCEQRSSATFSNARKLFRVSAPVVPLSTLRAARQHSSRGAKMTTFRKTAP
jgi:hypothetical protein